MSTQPDQELTTLNIGALLAGSQFSSDDDAPSQSNKNQKKRQKAKKNKALQQQHDSTPVPATSTNTSIKSEPTGGRPAASPDKFAKFALQRRLQFLSQSLQQAKADSIAVLNSDQPDATKRQMIEKLQASHRERLQKKVNTRQTKIEKKLASHISLETLRTNSAAIHLVEKDDPSAPDPFFLIFLKAYLLNVRLPPEWAQKRRIYSNKIGNEKTDFVIPQYIHNLNAAHLVIKEEKTHRAQLAEMARAKAHQHNIDYQTWYDAFYTHMPKIHWDDVSNTQYEGKFEAEQYTHFSPLDPLSSELQRALGMYSGSQNSPLDTIAVMPPWIPAMQQYGPPPAYPNVYIPGVTAPLPPGGSWSDGNGMQQFQGTTFWGTMPVINQPNSQGHFELVSRWGGDVMGQSPFIQKLQTVLQNKYMELSAQPAKGDGESSNAYLKVAELDPISSSTDPKPSLTGIWYPMPKMAPPDNDLSLLIKDKTPIQRQTIELRFMPTPSPLTNKTPGLFGAIDYIGFEDKLQQQIAEQEEMAEQRRLAHAQAQMAAATAPFAQASGPSQPAQSAEEDAAQERKNAYIQEQRQAQLDKALGSNARLVSTGKVDPTQFTGNMASSIYAPQDGQLFNEVILGKDGSVVTQPAGAVPQKRKQPTQPQAGEDLGDNLDGVNQDAIKRQRQ